MKPLSEILNEIDARAEKATPGPWSNETDWEYVLAPEMGEAAQPIGEGFTKRDSEFIAHSREDIPRLVAALKHALQFLEQFGGASDVAVHLAHLESILRGEIKL